ncbi:Uncharacterised protein [Mycoplasmoides gallisepticum]|uniref:Uncharacterized protein n=1 Tax=Mycoplasmoides gallisepticum TaxID=2096 RepID=A0A3B0PKI7_MYCGL|nr:Uncharacterised protein [Mycoplasmoides gallisepticum]
MVVNTSSELFNKPIDNFYDTTDGAVKTDELERSVKNGGFVKFTNNDYGTKFDISLVNSTASYNADTRELSFTVQVRSVNDDYHNSRSIQKIFRVTLGKNADE